MKIVAVYGSSRPGSLSAAVMDDILRGAADAGHEIVRYSINKLRFSGCIGCHSCKKHDSDCVLTDDLKPYFKDLHEAGALVLSGANYMGQVNGSMISFMNRHFCIGGGPSKGTRLTHPTRILSVFAQGAPTAVPAFEENYRWYHDIFVGMGFEDGGRFVVHGAPDLENAALRQAAYEAGKNL